MSALTVVVLAHVSMLVELMSVVRLCWTLRILSRRLRRGGGVLGWEASNYSWSDGFQNTFLILIKLLQVVVEDSCLIAGG